MKDERRCHAEFERCFLPLRTPSSASGVHFAPNSAWRRGHGFGFTCYILTGNKGSPMKVMVIVKASKDSEAGKMPSEKLLTEMGNFNEELVKAGVMLAGEGLHPSSRGARVRFGGKERTVIDGPFAETKELIAGFWIWKVNSMQEAIDWVKRCPNPHEEPGELEIRQVFDAEDFGEAFTARAARTGSEHSRADFATRRAPLRRQ